MLRDELLGALQAKIGRRDIAYAESPVRLGGGFFAENYGFRLTGAPSPWDVGLVVRLFPSSAARDQARREAAVQTFLVGQGYPAARVLLFDQEARLSGRRFFVMERLPGRPVLGGVRVRELALSGWWLLGRLPGTTASLQAALHRLDPTPLLTELGEHSPGIERFLADIEAQIAAGAGGLSAGLRWLVEHRPVQPARRRLCHGDLWAANILVEGSHVTGVVDWTVATVADPALDVGFTAMSFSLAPIDAPRAIQRAAARIAGGMCKRYIRAYRRETGADLSAQPYYEALRCAAELTAVAAYRLAEAKGMPHDVPRFTWESITDQMVDYFRARTGVTLDVPPAGTR